MTLDAFGDAARARVAGGYYDLKKLPDYCPPREPLSLVAALEKPGLVAEIKPASPTAGALRPDADAGALARELVAAGAAGISALAVREGFGGSLENVIAATSGGAPVLFKDFVVDEAQLKAARRCGASAVLLILDLTGMRTASLIERAHKLGLEALLEVYDEAGYEEAACLDADLLGINNRDLRKPGLPVDPQRAARILRKRGALAPTLALSGVETAEDVRRVVDAGARGALVGSTLMRAADPGQKLRALKEGLA